MAPTIGFQQLAIYRYIYVRFFQVEGLVPGPISPETLAKFNITAELVPAESLALQTPHFFEPMSVDEWAERGLQLPAADKFEPIPDDITFCYAYWVTFVLQRLLQDEAPGGDGVGLIWKSDWSFVE
jgi:hypothetical protein